MFETTRVFSPKREFPRNWCIFIILWIESLFFETKIFWNKSDFYRLRHTWFLTCSKFWITQRLLENAICLKIENFEILDFANCMLGFLQQHAWKKMIVLKTWRTNENNWTRKKTSEKNPKRPRKRRKTNEKHENDPHENNQKKTEKRPKTTAKTTKKYANNHEKNDHENDPRTTTKNTQTTTLRFFFLMVQNFSNYQGFFVIETLEQQEQTPILVSLFKINQKKSK